MALYSLFKIIVLCALFHEAAAAGTPACSGTRTEADPSSSPDGVYSQTNVDVPNIPQVQVKHIDVIFNQPQPFTGLQTYTLDLDACVVMGDMCMKIPDASAPFTDGHFVDTGSNQGSMFIPRSNDPRNPINELLKIQWCPDQNYFLVKFAGQLLEPLRQQPTVFSTVSPHPNTNDPNDYLGSRCIEIPPFGSPPLVPQCGSASAPPSGLACNCITITGTCNCVTTPCNCIGILERLCTCQPRVYFLNTVCNPKFVGTCGSSSYPSSGLSCQCSEVSIGPKKACTCQP